MRFAKDCERRRRKILINNSYQKISYELFMDFFVKLDFLEYSVNVLGVRKTLSKVGRKIM